MKTMTVNCSNCNIEFQKLISYIKSGEKRGYFKHFCSNLCSCKFNNNITKNVLPNKRKEEYLKNPKKCPNCSNTIPYRDKSWKKYCSSSCAAFFGQKNGGHCNWNKEDKKRISEYTKKLWKSGIYDNIKKEKICKICPNCNDKFFLFLYKINTHCCSKSCFSEWNKKTGYLKGKTGGFREKGGRGKQGTYKGYYYNSSWELAWIIYNIDHNISFERNTEGFEYKFNNQTKKYYPDFKLPDGSFLEIKGFKSDQVNAKISQFPCKLTVLDKDDIKKYTDYVKNIYGKEILKKEKTS